MSASARPRRGHGLRRLIITLVVLAGLFVAADRIAVVIAERAAADTIQRSEQLSQPPKVSIAGFPFLTQLAAGDLHRVTVRAAAVPVDRNNRSVTITAVTAVLHGVHIARDLSSARADSATASGTISYADLSEALGITIRYGGSADRVTTSVNRTLGGIRIAGSITATVALHASALAFVDPTLSAGGGSVPAVTLQGVFGAPVPLTNLPFGVRVEGLQAGPSGITVQLSGADLVYRR